MEIKIIDRRQGPEVFVCPSHPEGHLLVHVRYGRVALNAAVDRIALPNVDPTEIPSIRNGNKYVIRQLVEPLEDEPGSYFVPTGGRVTIATSETPRVTSQEVVYFQEVSPLSPEASEILNLGE